MPRAHGSRAPALLSLHANLLLILLLSSIPASTAQYYETCWFPGGAQAAGYAACGNSTDITTSARACCNIGDPCLANGLCFSPVIGVVYRGGCTNVNFEEEGCPNIFTTGSYANATANMYHCDAASSFSVENASCTGSYTYIWQGTSVIPYAGEPGAQDSVASSASSTPSSTSPSTSSSSPSSSHATGSAAASTGSPECAGNTTPNSGINSTALGVGVGIGLPMAALATAFGLLWWSERGKRLGAERDAATTGRFPPSSSAQGGVWGSDVKQNPAEVVGTGGGPYNLKGNPVHELNDGDTAGVPELPGRQ